MTGNAAIRPAAESGWSESSSNNKPRPRTFAQNASEAQQKGNRIMPKTAAKVNRRVTPADIANYIYDLAKSCISSLCARTYSWAVRNVFRLLHCPMW